jgi:hypothetical protein
VAGKRPHRGWTLREIILPFVTVAALLLIGIIVTVRY